MEVRTGEEKAQYERDVQKCKDVYISKGISKGINPAEVRAAVDIAHHACVEAQFTVKRIVDALDGDMHAIAMVIAFQMLEGASQDFQMQALAAALQSSLEGGL